MGALLANLSVAAAVLVAGLSALLCVTGALSYRRLRHPRLLWIAVAFALLTLQGLRLTQEALGDRTGQEVPWDPLLSLAIVAALYVAVLR